MQIHINETLVYSTRWEEEIIDVPFTPIKTQPKDRIVIDLAINDERHEALASSRMSLMSFVRGPSKATSPSKFTPRRLISQVDQPATIFFEAYPMRTNDKLNHIERILNEIVRSQIVEMDRQLKSAQTQTNHLTQTYGKPRSK